MKRIDTPMVGGVGSALMVVLVVFPALFSVWKARSMQPMNDGKQTIMEKIN